MGRESKKNILYIITKSVWAGASKYTHDLAAALPKDKYIPAVAAGGKGAMAEKIISAGIPYHEIKSFQRDVSPLKDVFAFFEILALLLKTKPDVVHASSAKAGGIAGSAAFVYKLLTFNFKLLTVFTAHGWTFSEPRPRWQIFLIELFSKITCVFYDKIICVSEYDYEIALKNKIAPAKKMVVIHNGIRPEEYDFLPRGKAREIIADRLAAKPPSGFWIGTVGEFTKNKGQKFLIEAIEKLSDAECRISSILIGFEGGEKRNLKSRIKSSGLAGKIFLAEGVPDAAKYLKAFDIFVLPSLKEGLPYVLLEAGLAGLPIIASDTGGIPEIIEDGKNGVLVKPADSKGLAEAIKMLVENPDKRNEFGKNAREKMLKDFLFEKTLNKTLAAYENDAATGENPGE